MTFHGFGGAFGHKPDVIMVAAREMSVLPGSPPPWLAPNWPGHQSHRGLDGREPAGL